MEDLEHAHQQWAVQHAVTLTEADRQAILALAEQVPTLWQAPSTTPADRKQLLRLVIQGVSVDAKVDPGALRYRIVWQTGAVTEGTVRRNVHRYTDYPRWAELEAQIRALNALERTDAEIATALNEAGFPSARGRRFSSKQVWLLRQQFQVPAVKPNGNDPHPPRWPDGTYSIQGLAEAVGVTVGPVYRWVHRGQVGGHQSGKGMPWKLSITPADIEDLKRYVQRVRRTKRSRKEAL